MSKIIEGHQKIILKPREHQNEYAEKKQNV